MIAGPRIRTLERYFARQIFGHANPIGRAVISRAEPGYPETAYEVVGVVKDSNYLALREQTPPVSFAPATQDPHVVPSLAIVTRSTTVGSPSVASLSFRTGSTAIPAAASVAAVPSVA